MRRSRVDGVRTAVVYLGLLLFHLVGEGSVVRVLSQPGHMVRLPCSYHYEDDKQLPQLSVQWRNPQNVLLCHYVKHKEFQRCSSRYSINYRPGNITLIIHYVQEQDFGTHICSVNKPHEFSDYSVELARLTDWVTAAPNSGQKLPGPSWTLVLLHILGSFICQ